MNERKTVAAATLGCKVNAYDTEAVLEAFREVGYKTVSFNERADVYIINTCAVTATGEKKSRQMIRRARKTNPDALVAVMGCYAQIKPGEVEGLGAADIITGSRDRKKLTELVENHKPGISRAVLGYDNCDEYENTHVSGFLDRQRAYLKIQDGCDNFCAYCVVPYARGRSRSRGYADIIEEAERVAAGGANEIVITGINIASYDGSGNSLADVIRGVACLDGVKRVRLGSIEPLVVTPVFLEVLSELPGVCGHFHLSLQSGCDETLRRMNRRYTAEEYGKAVFNILSVRSDAAITTDVIAGFPGETEEEHRESYNFIKGLELADLHVFPYSKRPETAAAQMSGQVDKFVKDRRAAELIQLGGELKARFTRRFIGAEYDVLFEKNAGGAVYEGLTHNYITVRAESGVDITNQILPVRLDSFDGGIAFGCIKLL